MFNRLANGFGTIGGGLVTLGTLGGFCLFTVEPGKRAVILNQFSGVKSKVYNEGLHFKLPFVESQIEYSVRIMPKTHTTVTGTKDLQQVGLKIRVLQRPMAEKIKEIHLNLGQNQTDTILPSVINEVLKATVAQYNADQLLTKRDIINREINESMQKRALIQNIEINDACIIDINFSREFAKSIEDKQIEYQNAERAKFINLIEEEKAKIKIIQSEATMEQARITGEGLKEAGEGYLTLVRLENSKTVASNLAANPNLSQVPSGGNILMNVSK